VVSPGKGREDIHLHMTDLRGKMEKLQASRMTKNRWRMSRGKNTKQVIDQQRKDGA
jgi:cold shock CspA family protein